VVHLSVCICTSFETLAVEPRPPDLELPKFENATFTPHIAGASLTTVEVAAAAVAEDTRRYLAGETPLNPATG
jgi:D-3-phosphoglycerate dehydrogenase